MDEEEITVSHTPVEAENVEQIEALSSDELQDQFSMFLLSALRDDPNTEVAV